MPKWEPILRYALAFTDQWAFWDAPTKHISQANICGEFIASLPLPSLPLPSSLSSSLSQFLSLSILVYTPKFLFYLTIQLSIILIFNLSNKLNKMFNLTNKSLYKLALVSFWHDPLMLWLVPLWHKKMS